MCVGGAAPPARSEGGGERDRGREASRPPRSPRELSLAPHAAHGTLEERGVRWGVGEWAASTPPSPPSGPPPCRGGSRRGRCRVRGRAPGTRAPAATRGTPRRLPPLRASPPGWRPRRGARPEPPRSGTGAVGGRGGGSAVPRGTGGPGPAAPRPSPAADGPPAGARRPSLPLRPVARRPVSPSARPPPPLPRPRGESREGKAGVDRGPRVPGASPAARSLLLALLPPLFPIRDATSDQTWRPAEFKHISQRRKRN